MGDTSIATDFDFKPLPDGNVLIKFFGGDGHTINCQVVTINVVSRIPFVATMTEMSLKEGPEVAKRIMEELRAIGCQQTEPPAVCDEESQGK